MEVESHEGDGPEVSMNGVDGDPPDSGPVDKEAVLSEPADPSTPPDDFYQIPEMFRPYYEGLGIPWPDGDIDDRD